jgi:ABC-type sugar transport system ATPase subunit
MTSLTESPASGSAVDLVGITKRFGGATALSEVSLSIALGEVHGLVGENGAGKSTLGRIVCGIHQPDHGILRVFGRTVEGWTTSDALAGGVAMIQQEPTLVPALTVAANVFLGIERHRWGFVVSDIARRFQELRAKLAFDLEPDVLVGRLRIADQQKVEIMRAFARNARVIVMDEPTSALTLDEAEKLFRIVRQLRTDGRTVIYVSHALDDVLRLCDRISVLRDGALVRTSRAPDETKDTIVEAMLGRPLDLTFPARKERAANGLPPSLVLVDVSGGMVRNVSFEIRPGEILGLAGLVGSGRSELVRLIFGADPVSSGYVEVAGEAYSRTEPHESIARKVVMVPEDRRVQGLVLEHRVEDNLSLPHLGRFSRFGFVLNRTLARIARQIVERLRIMPARLDRPVGSLSGGNQQKVLFGKWMAESNRVVLLDEPTRGIDVGAKAQIYQIIVDLAASGAAVLLISSELEEVVGLADRVLLMRNGEIVGELDPRRVNTDDVVYKLFEAARPSGETVSPARVPEKNGSN